MESKGVRSEDAQADTCARSVVARLLDFRRPPARRFMVTFCFSAALTILCFVAPACIVVKSGCTEEYFAQHPEDCDYIGGVQVDGPRFEFPPPVPSPNASPVPIKPSRDFWLKSGDELIARWNEYSLIYNQIGVTCDFTTNPPPSNRDCDICTICNTGRGCHHPTAFAPGTLPELLRFDAFRLESEPVVETLWVEDPCDAGHSFAPPKNATYRLLKYPNSVPVAETKVFVVEPGGVGQRITYQLSPLTQETADAIFYQGFVPGDPILEDNFSNNLHITRVRILKGTPSRDPVTGKLQLANASVVHPSRIVLISDYDGGQIYEGRRDSTRCYANGSEDGDLDLTRCRATSTAVCPGSASCLQSATPTSLTGSGDVFTWIAEFKPTEGGIAPVFENGEILAIEFTIEAN